MVVTKTTGGDVCLLFVTTTDRRPMAGLSGPWWRWWRGVRPQKNRSPISLFTYYLHHLHHHYRLSMALMATASVVTNVVTKARMVAT